MSNLVKLNEYSGPQPVVFSTASRCLQIDETLSPVLNAEYLIINQLILDITEKEVLSRRHTRRFYIAANLVASKNLERTSPVIDSGTLGDFFTPIAQFCNSSSSPDYVQAIFRGHVCLARHRQQD